MEVSVEVLLASDWGCIRCSCLGNVFESCTFTGLGGRRGLWGVGGGVEVSWCDGDLDDGLDDGLG